MLQIVLEKGGVLSPILFNIYTDDLSKLLSATNVGCTLNNVNFNHLAYADDMVLLAPSPTALQELLFQCELYAVDHSMIYNVKKTVCMCVKPKMFRDLHVYFMRIIYFPLIGVLISYYLRGT